MLGLKLIRFSKKKKAPGDAHTRQWIKSWLDKVMACDMFGIIPLLEAMVI